METARTRLLLVMEQCNPAWTSVPQVAFQFFNQLREIADVTLVTHERNREALESILPDEEIEFIDESKIVKNYYGVVAKLTSRGGVNWPLQHTLSYPVYAEFDGAVAKRFSGRIEDGEFDAVMGMTPILPRYPYRLSGSSKKVPFILGPVNGGLPFPEAFGGIAAKESARFNFLRSLSKLLPGYARTYESADRVLAGSNYTLGWIRDTFQIDEHRLCHMAENGVADSYFDIPIKAQKNSEPMEILFAGRLVPYKGGDMLLDAVIEANKHTTRELKVTFVGDGPEMDALKSQAKEGGIEANVEFTGLVPPQTMPDQFAKADLFCFPSIREFGGAVVLEAMASGVPCVVADHGGIGEYVTENSGVKIPPRSREFLVEEFAQAICKFAADSDLLRSCAEVSRERAEEYRWSNKVAKLMTIIEEAIEEKQGADEVALTA